jgi:5'-phosphate synthase pdxT subunit
VKVGVLALQGAFAAHEPALRSLGHDVTYLRAPADFEGIDGLILPGGESSVHLALIERFGLEPSILLVAARGKPILATCAGLILCAREVTSPQQRSLGLLDVEVERNAYGRQLDSFEGLADDGDLPVVFIRAPRIVRCASQVDVLATYRGEPIWIRQGRVIGAAFHPELTADLRVHRAAFGGDTGVLNIAASSSAAPGAAAARETR